ncbi:sigma-70 family RNA polymerase sigma factor [Methylocapsa palsarum]|uniref:RNA polymerase primary sigma factor n=1 Tax=Methylocapsa palsarum TaxID=1612308 RepID=A0A1I4D1S6_9HYPH|nr:sigma-70 family RNA polymerase sigma factor [Methylocapsa palsarum]SFK87452.1 RNA polymerase primary sigma factor [Methylocapsa palsarum]
MKFMDRLSRILGNRAQATSEQESHVLGSFEIRLIAEGKPEKLADFAASSRLHATDPKGDTPLHLAGRMGNLAVCDLFIRSGANPASLNHNRQTPADVAFAEGHGLAAQLLSSLVAKSPEPKTVDEREDIAEIETAPAGTDADPEHRFTLVQGMEPNDTTDNLDNLLSFEAEAEPEEFFGQYTGEAASGTFIALISSARAVSDDEDGDWNLDFSPANIAGGGIDSSAAAAVDHGAENDFLKVRNRGRQSIKRAVVQTGTRLSIDPAICTTWVEQTLAKGWWSFEDVDRLVAHCEGNGDLEELRINLQRNLEAAGFDLVQENGHDAALWDARSDISPDDLPDAIEAVLTRATRLPGTRRFVMDKSYELQLLEPMVRAKQDLQLGILASEVAVETILDVVDNIRDGFRDPGTVSLRTIIPSRPGHDETAEVMAAAETLKSWQTNGRVMDGKRRREALMALDALDFSLAFHKELVRILKQDPACQELAVHLDAQILIFEAATERLIREHLPYVRRFAARNVHEGEEPEDVFQVAFMGLQRSTWRFDPERGYRFLIYATYWMRQAITRWRADEGTAIRVPVHRHENLTKLDRAMDKLGVRSKGIVSDDDLAVELEWTADQVRQFRSIPREAEYPESIDDWDALLPEQENSDVFDLAEAERIIANAIAELQERQADIIRMRFGIGRDSEMTLEEIGQLYGLTRERIRQIETKALRVLGHSTRLGRFAFLLES